MYWLHYFYLFIVGKRFVVMVLRGLWETQKRQAMSTPGFVWWVFASIICNSCACAQETTCETKPTTGVPQGVNTDAQPVFPCVRQLPRPPGWQWLAGARASRDGWHPLASSVAPWVFSCRSGSHSLTGWQLGHYLGCRNLQTLGERPKERERQRRRYCYMKKQRRFGTLKTWNVKMSSLRSDSHLQVCMIWKLER